MGKGKGFSFNQGIVLGLVLLLAVGVGMYFKQPASAVGGVVQEPVASGDCDAVQCFQNPAYTYGAVNEFTSGAVSGTNHIKVDGKAPVASLANPEKCSVMQYWLESTTDFCGIVDETEVACGSNQIQSRCIANGSISLNAFDQFTALTAGGGANNITLGANGIKNVDFTWEGAAEQANMPMGGCLCVEYPNTISYAKPSGAGLSDTSCRFKKTYTVASTGNTYQCYDVPEGFDADGVGDKKSFALQMKASASDPSGTAKVTFFPANYYVTDDGDFALGVEKDLNDDTAATFGSANSLTIGIN